jgi:glycosyltransferase involved in cell wall biosynthesis
MSKPLVSVLCPSMRVGGLDVLVAGLRAQTFKDFELVFSDAIAEHRNRLIETLPNALASDLMWHTPFNIVHVRPRDHRFPLNTYCRVMNEGLVAANGEIVLLITDYTWLPPDLIERHVRFHEANGPKAGFMGPHRYVRLPELSPVFEKYVHSEQETARYVSDVRSGRLDSCMFSIFAEPYNRNAAEEPEDGYARDGKRDQPAGPIGFSYLHCKNESVRLEHLIAINGFDEDLDESHAYQDSDIADRLSVKRGIDWQLDPTMIAHIVNPRTIFPLSKRLRSHQDNERVWRAKQAAGYPRVNNWSLAEAREWR